MVDIFDSLCVLLAKAEQKHFAYTKKALETENLEISPGQLVVLYVLYKKDNISISELSKNVLLDNSTLTGLIDRLERLGLVMRMATPNDRRSFQIILTEKALERKADLTALMKRVEKQMLTGVSTEEIATFRKTLHAIFTNLSL
ncbi:MAG: MarR family transcriptional regulator [Sporomusaceae bacterium]|nr:MarR family transcriptional regulator [Sporomusaceae bacterium]